MSNISRILEFNNQFVENKEYEHYLSDRLPSKKIAILTCMDTRLVELLPAALGVKNGDVKIIKCAGAQITSPYDSSIRSLLIGVTELGVEDIMVIGHTQCGTAALDAKNVRKKLISLGVSEKTIDSCEIDFDTWLNGFGKVEDSVRETVSTLRKHPLMPSNVVISGYVIDIKTGKLTPV